jgi:hypothetical protein
MKKNIILTFLILGCLFVGVVSFAHSEDDEQPDPCAHYEDEEERSICLLNTRHQPAPRVPAPTPAPSPVPSPLPAVAPRVVLPSVQTISEEVETHTAENSVSQVPSQIVSNGGYDLSPQNPKRGEGLSPTFFEGRDNKNPFPCISVEAQDDPNTPLAELTKPPCAQTPPEIAKKNRAQGPDIVIVTDQASKEKADHVRKAFFAMPPFRCMDLDIEIHYIEKNTLGCEPFFENGILKCTNKATRQVQAYRDQRKATGDILVVDWNDEKGKPVFGGGNFKYDKQRLAIISTGHIGEAGVHEFMHTIGFDDEYPKRELAPGQPRYPVSKGTLMNSTYYGNIPTEWWPTIANYFGVPVPQTCEWPR